MARDLQLEVASLGEHPSVTFSGVLSHHHHSKLHEISGFVSLRAVKNVGFSPLVCSLEITCFMLNPASHAMIAMSVSF